MLRIVSAIKRDGVPLYKLARQGKVVDREPRFVHVYAHELRAIRLPEIDFRVICSKGFYVRTYAHDIGLELQDVEAIFPLCAAQNQDVSRSIRRSQSKDQRPGPRNGGGENNFSTRCFADARGLNR